MARLHTADTAAVPDSVQARLDRFCAHRELHPATMLQAGKTLNTLRQASVRIVQKLAQNLASAVASAGFAARLGEVVGDYRPCDKLDRDALVKATFGLYRQALRPVETKLGEILTAVTGHRIRVSTNTAEVCNWLAYQSSRISPTSTMRTSRELRSATSTWWQSARSQTHGSGSDLPIHW